MDTIIKHSLCWFQCRLLYSIYLQKSYVYFNLMIIDSQRNSDVYLV